MGTFNTEGIVLRHTDYRENDRMLVLLTPNGRVDALCRGCKRPRSALLAASEVFTLGNYELVTAKDRITVSSCLLRDSFYDLRLDIQKLSCASYMANICEAAVQPGENAQRPFLLLARALGYLCYHPYAPRAVLCAFLLHYAVAMGYRPRLDCCTVCGKGLDLHAGALFDIEQGGIVCPDCGGHIVRGAALDRREAEWLREALAQGVRGKLPAQDAPLELMQAFLEARIDRRIPPLAVPL